MKTLSPEVQANRQLFLEALRSGEYPKGPTETDAMGRPIDPDASGYCVVGLAHNLFEGPIQTRSPLPMRKALGLSPQQFTKMQQIWNDSELTFPEIADLIEDTMFSK